MKNIIYLKHVLAIGGVETFIYELAKKYHEKYEIVLYYETADEYQLRRLRRYIQCEKFVPNRRYECDKFITNYDISMIDYVDAKEYIEIIHANFMRQPELQPHTHKKINYYVAVSQEVADAWKQRTGIKCKYVCPNPLTFEEVTNEPLFIFAAQRMSKEKGVERIIELTRRLDEDPEIKYYMLICTNNKTNTYALDIFQSKNVAIMPSNIDIRHLIASCDLFTVLSSSEGRCYSAAEKLASGHGKLLATPLPVFKEMGADKYNTIYLDFDMKNINEVIEQIRKMYKDKQLSKDFKPVTTKDKWNKILAKGTSNYKPIRYVTCRATDQWVKKNIILRETGKQPTENEILTITEDRYAELHDNKTYNCCLVTDKKYI